MSTGSIDRGICVTCGGEFPYEKLQAGHFIAGRNNAVLFQEQGVHAQCVGCNYFGNGQHQRYYAFMKDRYGQDTIDALEREANQHRKFTVSELKEMEKMYKRRAEYVEQHEQLPPEGEDTDE